MDDFSYILPLKFTREYEIVDAQGTIICPSITYKGDKYHLEKQKKAGNFIVETINNKFGYFLIENNWKQTEKMSTKIVESGGETVAMTSKNGWDKRGRK